MLAKTICSRLLKLCQEGRVTPPFEIRFEEEGHRYWIDGVAVPSVTQVVQQLHNFPAHIDATAAMQRGTAVHRACELIVRGILDPTTLDEAIYDDVHAFADWWAVAQIQPLLVETIVGSRQYRFAGRIDLFGVWKGAAALIDIQTGAEYPAYRFQTAALEIALRESLGHIGRFEIERYCLYLDGGKAKVVKHEDARDKSIFLAALTCSHARREMYG